MTTYFCTGVIGDEQHIRVGWVGGSGAELVPPESDLASTFQLPGYQAYRLRVSSRLATELKVDQPDLCKGQMIKMRGCYWLSRSASRRGRQGKICVEF